MVSLSVGIYKLVPITELYLEWVTNIFKGTAEELCGKATSARELSEMRGQSNADDWVST